MVQISSWRVIARLEKGCLDRRPANLDMWSGAAIRALSGADGASALAWRRSRARRRAGNAGLSLYLYGKVEAAAGDPLQVRLVEFSVAGLAGLGQGIGGRNARA